MAVKIIGKNLRTRKPAQSAKHFIPRLRNGTAYSLGELADKWGISERTIEDHAKSIGCLRWMDTDDGWVKVVVNPETADKLKSEEV